MIGKQISTDKITLFLDFIFTPWVSQVYLTLAAFNLSRKSQDVFKDELLSKMKMFSFIFLFFVLENFIVAPNLGQAISFYPIMLWMVIMSVISICYSLLGIKSIIVLMLLSFLRWVIPMEIISNLFQEIVATNIHPGFEYDARIEYFFTSGCLGFLMGYVHYHRPNLKHQKDIYFFLGGTVLVAFYLAYGEQYIQNAADIFWHEHDLARTFSGSLYILGIQLIVISTFLWLEKKSIKFKNGFLNWVGRNSLIIFALHRIFFVRIIAPLSVMFGTFFGRTIGATVFEVYIYIGITIAFCYFVKVSRMGDIILLKK
jgi:hypothetical protein